MTKCRICESPVEPFMSFGRMPIANGFLRSEDFDKEYFFELLPAICGECGMFQIRDQPAPEAMFHENYAFYSSTSVHMARHFARAADAIKQRYLSEKPFVVEIGSNDGIMLRNFADSGISHLGIEPSANVAEVAKGAGISTICAFFDEALAEGIISEQGKADVVFAANVICHIPDFPVVAKGVKKLLKPEGVFMFEDPYLGDMVAKTSYDQIYDEHVFIFSATSIRNAVRPHGLELVDVEPQSTHGGSMRYVIAHEGKRPVSNEVTKLLEREEISGLSNPETFGEFRRRCERSRSELMEVLHRCRDEGKRVIGYAATSKSTTVTNYCGVTPDLVECIVDTTPSKQGLFSPGAHLPVRAYEKSWAPYPDYALLFAWNHMTEIMEKEQRYTTSGGKWIAYVPNVRILDS